MADAKSHTRQAHSNRNLAEFLLKHNCYPDWVATACFYSALHYIDAFLANWGDIHPTDHAMRDSLVNRLSLPVDVQDAYNELKHCSFAARYLCRAPTMAKARDRYVPLLGTVEQYVLRCLEHQPPEGPATITKL
jgi:HEPN domain-containing protein